MKHFIQRNHERTEHDDFVLNVQPSLGVIGWATPVFSEEGLILGWSITSAYE